jgi:hypothetical protein
MIKKNIFWNIGKYFISLNVETYWKTWNLKDKQLSRFVKILFQVFKVMKKSIPEGLEVVCLTM